MRLKKEKLEKVIWVKAKFLYFSIFKTENQDLLICN